MRSASFSNRASFDPVQRQNQWKHRISREESGGKKVERLNPITGVPTRGPTPNVIPGLTQPYAGNELEPPALVPRLNTAAAVVRAAGDPAWDSGRSFASTVTDRSIRSMAPSFRSSESGLTERALERIDRLEATLEEERRRRESTEKELEQLRAMVDDGASAYSGWSGRSGRSSRSSRSGLPSARSDRSDATMASLLRTARSSRSGGSTARSVQSARSGRSVGSGRSARSGRSRKDRVRRVEAVPEVPESP